MPSVEDQFFAEIAVNRGYLRQSAADECLGELDQLLAEGVHEELHTLAVKKGLLTAEQVQQVLKAQATRSQVGSYELLAKLGEGGMGAVYMARVVTTGKIVAIKILPPRLAEDAEFLARFVREAAAAIQLHHENVVAGIEHGTASGYRYFAMEFVEGRTLGSYLDEVGRVSEEYAVHVAIQVCRGLEHALSLGLIHRDVKPDNVLLTPRPHADGSLPPIGTLADIAKITDLGLAKITGQRKSRRVTHRGRVVGTPDYISPEQAMDLPDVDFRADIYSLGASLYHMLTGRMPFDGSSAADIMAKQIHEPPVHPREIDRNLNPGLCAVILQCMRKRPEDRYHSYAALIADLQLAQERKHPANLTGSRVDMPPVTAAAASGKRAPTTARRSSAVGGRSAAGHQGRPDGLPPVPLATRGSRSRALGALGTSALADSRARLLALGAASAANTSLSVVLGVIVGLMVAFLLIFTMKKLDLLPHHKIGRFPPDRGLPAATRSAEESAGEVVRQKRKAEPP